MKQETIKVDLKEYFELRFKSLEETLGRIEDRLNQNNKELKEKIEKLETRYNKDFKEVQKIDFKVNFSIFVSVLALVLCGFKLLLESLKIFGIV